MIDLTKWKFLQIEPIAHIYCSSHVFCHGFMIITKRRPRKLTSLLWVFSLANILFCHFQPKLSVLVIFVLFLLLSIVIFFLFLHWHSQWSDSNWNHSQFMASRHNKTKFVQPSKEIITIKFRNKINSIVYHRTSTKILYVISVRFAYNTLYTHILILFLFCHRISYSIHTDIEWIWPKFFGILLSHICYIQIVLFQCIDNFLSFIIKNMRR